MSDPSQRFADLLVELNLVTEGQVREGLAEHGFEVLTFTALAEKQQPEEVSCSRP